MKLFEMEGFLRGKCIPRDLKVNETNAEYLVRKFAEADAMCAALAADNAGLMGAIETHKHGFVRCNCCGDELMCHTDDVCRALDETPATDAFLAEVRAQESKRVYESILDNPAVTDMESLVDWLEQNANDSVAFAAQLRKGVQQ
ncbi:hypothetical protein V7S82_20600 [Enterobacter hormaechei subsp. steigerwaltii]|uniref:hypothetical protein n=1 Tax=Enterobacter hormaechei TaxID=158836 RepID=UPI002FD07E3A